MHKSVKIAFFWIGVAFLSLIVATVVTLRHATDQKISVVDNDYYEKGLNYEKVIETQKQMIAEGYDFSGEPLAPEFRFTTGKNSIDIQFTKNGKPVPGAEVSILLERSATDDFNVKVNLQNRGTGNFSGVLDIPDPGDWTLTVNGIEGGRLFKKTLILHVAK